MKPPSESREQDILDLITNQVQEDLNLDYKGCDSLGRSDGKKREISKDVSAFANSAGGTIVYGVIEDKHLPVRIDVGFDPTDITREWLEQVINSNIRRRIDGVRINQVALNQTNPGKVIYVISIPQSVRAPHMAADHRFYKRFNFESVPMEEYEVRDVARRSETPDLHLTFYLSGGPEVPLQFEADALESQPVGFLASIMNESPKPAEHIVITLFIDTRLKVVELAGLTISGEAELKVGSETIRLTYLVMNWAVPGKMPVWSDAKFSISDTPVGFRVPQGSGQYLLGWELKSPRMTPREGFYNLISTGSAVTLKESG